MNVDELKSVVVNPEEKKFTFKTQNKFGKKKKLVKDITIVQAIGTLNYEATLEYLTKNGFVNLSEE